MYPLNQNSNQIRNWLLACRPKTLPASIAPVLLGVAISYSENNHSVSVINTVCILSCAILIQLTTNFANDLYDFKKGADTPERLGPTRAVQAGLISEKNMLKASIASTLLSIIIGLYLVNTSGLPILIIGIFSLIFAFLYTAGPYPLAYLGLGEVFVFIFFGPVAVWGTSFILTAASSSDAIIAGAGLGLISSAILAANNLRDIKTDLLAGKKTLAARFGLKFAKAEYSMLILFPAIIAAYFFSRLSYQHSILLLFYVSVAITLSYKAHKNESSEFQIKLLENTGKLLLFYTTLLSYAFICMHG